MTIKGLAENNFMGIKQYIGLLSEKRLKKSSGYAVAKNAPKDLLSMFFDGIYFNRNPKMDWLVYSRQDRPDLIWYNVITLETLMEYYTGPCKINLKKLNLKKIKPLIVLL